MDGVDLIINNYSSNCYKRNIFKISWKNGWYDWISFKIRTCL